MQVKKLFFLLPILFWQCAEKEFDPNNPSKSFAIAKEPYDDANYDIAITRLGEFKARFPYSQYASEAELLIADSHFELGHYAEAAVAYEQFVKLHPKHKKIAFAMYRAGECYWSQAPDEIDREQDFTRRSIDEWDKLIAKLPNSPEARKAKKLVAEGHRRIAESIDFIAGFYCKMEVYHACAFRYLRLVELYPDFKDLKRHALSEAASAFEVLAKEKQEDPKSDKNIYFKTMTSQQLTTKANELRSEARQLGRDS